MFQTSAGLTALAALGSPAWALQGQPVTAEDRRVGLAFREVVEGTSTGLGGAPLITISGAPGSIYQLFMGIGVAPLAPPFADVAVMLPGVVGPVCADLIGLDPTLFVPDTGVVGVIPPSGVQSLDLAFPFPAGLAGLILDLQVLTLDPGGMLEVTNGQMRQIMPPPPAVPAWALGAAYPTSPGIDWADIEQGDVDGDGDNDTVGAGASGLQLWLTTGGTHVPASPDPFAAFLVSATSVELADFNRDGFLDVASAYFAGQYFRAWQNNGLDPLTGAWLGFTLIPFASHGFTTGPANPADVEVADVDGDGFLDVFFACALSATAGQRNRLFLNTSTSDSLLFAEATLTNLPVIFDDSEDCEFLDFDVDGDQDIVIANVDGTFPATPFGQGGDYILVNQGFAQGGPEGTYLAPMPNPVPALVVGDTSESLDVAVGDIDADGFLDLYFSDWAISPTPGLYTTPAVAGQDRVLLLRFPGGVPTYVDFTATLLPAPFTFGTDAEILDVDFDGDLDIVTALGSLGAGAPVAVLPFPNISRGAPVLINPGTLSLFTRVPIPAVSELDFRDVEHGDWREVISAGGFGRFFEKDIGCATLGVGATLTTLDHL